MDPQRQFLNVLDRDEAQKCFEAALRLAPLGEEIVPLDRAFSRVAARDVLSPVDVPSFDRSNFDGFAVRAADTHGASEESPRSLVLLGETIATGRVPQGGVGPGTAMTIATGAMLPRSADAVVMVEHADFPPSVSDKIGVADKILVRRALSAGFGVSFAGTDVATGETVVRQGELLSSRETGVLAAVGIDRLAVWRRPVVAILSTGDEIIAPGQPSAPARVFDSNAQIIADAVRELGAEPLRLGIVRDELPELSARLQQALGQADVVLLSGGTSKGAGDLCYDAVARLDPGILVHGVALKPGKPLCLAASGGKPVVVLPGFPTSAIFTFHEFVAPVIRRLAGRPADRPAMCRARLAVRVNSEIGRTEYVLVGLVADAGAAPGSPSAAPPPLVAYPMGKGSGSVTAFSRADGFVTIDRHVEIVESGTMVDVQLLSRDLKLADLVVLGSHCIGLDFLLGELQRRGLKVKFLAIGSTGGLEAAKRGECDLAGIHLLDAATGQYNSPFVTSGLQLVRGYRRRQGLAFRAGDVRFAGKPPAEAIKSACQMPDCVMVNRNQGSGTRILIDRLLVGERPPGYPVQASNHHAVAAAIVQGRADWGVTIERVATQAGLGFLPIQPEHFDFVVPTVRLDRRAVRAFIGLLSEPEIRKQLSSLGCEID
ncbi:MAG: molybdopterin biosynthesis protein [Planctomycetia bacterium]|nr:molybdopterin biosynthesis protein [Planctomycetia bacterium]